MGATVDDPVCECEYGPTRWGRGAETADTCASCGDVVRTTTPDDPIGTVRATAGLLAVRARSVAAESDELSWFVIDIGDDGATDPNRIESMLATWPVVHRP